MKELNEFDNKIAYIKKVLEQYELDYTNPQNTCNTKFTHTTVDGKRISISTLISDETTYLDKFEQGEKSLLEGTSIAKESADASYKQAEQSSMLYNLSVSSIVNLCGGILILIFFIGKESGLSIKSTKATGAKASGTKAPDVKASRTKATSAKASGTKETGAKSPIIKKTTITLPKSPSISPASN